MWTNLSLAVHDWIWPFQMHATQLEPGLGSCGGLQPCRSHMEKTCVPGMGTLRLIMQLDYLQLPSSCYQPPNLRNVHPYRFPIIQSYKVYGKTQFVKIRLSFLIKFIAMCSLLIWLLIDFSRKLNHCTRVFWWSLWISGFILVFFVKFETLA